MSATLLPPAAPVPDGLVTPLFHLRPLGPEHAVADLEAWSSSVEHIRRTPGFAGRSWPPDTMSLADNERDLVRHREDFAAGRGFTYTVLDPATGDVVGCLYLYPSQRLGHDVDVRSWVRADRAELDRPLHDAVRAWLARSWPFQAPDYAPR